MHTDEDFDAYRRSTERLGRLKLFRYALFPPRDIRMPIFEAKLLVEGGMLAATAMCVHRYRGPYEIGVTCMGRIDNPVSHLGRVQLRVTFLNGMCQRVWNFEREIEKNGRPWWAGPGRNGFTLACYAVPDDVAATEQLRCEVEIIDVDGALDWYRPCSVYSEWALRK